MKTILLDQLKSLSEAFFMRVLHLDARMQTQLAALEGQHIECVWRVIEMGVRVSVVNGKIVFDKAVGNPDLTIRANLQDIGLWFIQKMQLPQRESSRPRIEISGDVLLAKTLSEMITTFEPDFTQVFTTVFGDLLGPQIAYSFQKALLGFWRQAKHFATDVRDYLVDESQDIVQADEINDFAAQVQKLRADVARLEQRLQQRQA